MPNELTAKKVAFLVANDGVEQVELTSPWQALAEQGATLTLLAPQTSAVQAVNNDIDKGDTFEPDLAVADASVGDYDLLVLPGGVANPDKLRLDAGAVQFVKDFAEAGKTVAAICHGPWTLVEAGVLSGKNLTSWPSLQTDVRNAGGTWHDTEVFVCPANDWTLITSRKPDDLDAFNSAIADALGDS